MIKTSRMQMRFLPITAYQEDMVAQSADPCTPDAYHLYFTLQWAYRIGSGLRPRLLENVFEKLVARHDSLRLGFVKHKGKWVSIIHEQHPTGLQMIDASAMSRDERDALINGFAQTPIRAHEGPCFQMHLIRCGDEGDVLLVRAHHAIIDGFGAIILVEDMIKLLVRLPLTGKATTHEEFVNRIARETRTDKDKKIQFWMDRLLPLPEDLNIGRRARGLPPFFPKDMEKTLSLNAILSGKESRELEKLASSSGASAFSLIYVAFSEAICAMADQDEVMICSWLGRQDVWTQSFVGVDNRMVQQIYRRNAHSLLQKAEDVSQQIYDAIQAQPSDVFLPGSPFMDVLEAQNRTLWRFQIHNLLPSARINSSPFGKSLWPGANQKFKLGPFSIERLNFKRDCESRFELSVFTHKTDDGHNANLVADAAAFSAEDLNWISHKLKTVLFG
jgi:hypothetical protein